MSPSRRVMNSEVRRDLIVLNALVLVSSTLLVLGLAGIGGWAIMTAYSLCLFSGALFLHHGRLLRPRALACLFLGWLYGILLFLCLVTPIYLGLTAKAILAAFVFLLAATLASFASLHVGAWSRTDQGFFECLEQTRSAPVFLQTFLFAGVHLVCLVMVVAFQIFSRGLLDGVGIESTTTPLLAIFASSLALHFGWFGLYRLNTRSQIRLWFR